MTNDEIKEYVRKCPYSDKSIDSMHTCDLEFHYRKICPSAKCACAKKFWPEGEEKVAVDCGMVTNWRLLGDL